MHKNELRVGNDRAEAVKLKVYIKGKNAKKFRQEWSMVRKMGDSKRHCTHYQPVLENNILRP